MQQAKDRPRRHNTRAFARATRRRRLRWAPLLLCAALLPVAPAHADTGGASAASNGMLPGRDIAFSAMRTGGATWYGPGFYGRHTACGQVLRPNTVGVAHRSLPCGTAVRFAYRGRYIVTTVIDRGPYTRGNLWDLTNGARQALGFSGSGRLRYSVALSFARN